MSLALGDAGYSGVTLPLVNRGSRRPFIAVQARMALTIRRLGHLMVPCTNCGWLTVPELIRNGLCLTCSVFEQRTGNDRPPPDTLEHLHRGETWPSALDPFVRALVAAAAAKF